MPSNYSIDLALESVFAGVTLKGDLPAEDQVVDFILNYIARYETTLATLREKDMHELEQFKELQMDLARVRTYVGKNYLIDPIFLGHAIKYAKLKTLDALL